MWFVKMALAIVGVLAVGLLGTAIARLFRRRTIDAWFGTGINDALTPAEAALLIGMHPGAIMALLYDHVHRLGLVRLADETPITVEWTGRSPSGTLERAFRGAFDGEGRLDPDGLRHCLDVLFEEVNGKMIPYSGLKTAIHYENMAQELWAQMQAGNHPEPAAYPWLLLLDSSMIWDEIGKGAAWDELKTMHRIKERLRAELFGMDEITRFARGARAGFFRYRKDLVVAKYWVKPQEVVDFEVYR